MNRAILCAICAFLLAAGSTFADQPATNTFHILKISRQTWNGFVDVDNGWKTSVKTLRVSLRVEEDLGTATPFCHAYFFDKDRKLVSRLGMPNRVQKGGQYESMPTQLKPKTTYDVYFAIPEKASSSGSRWDTVIIVFGSGERAVAELYPSGSGDLSNYTFDDKRFVVKAAE